MRTVSITQLKAALREHLALVKRGEVIEVTVRGKPVAQIVRVDPPETEADRKGSR